VEGLDFQSKSKTREKKGTKWLKCIRELNPM